MFPPFPDKLNQKEVKLIKHSSKELHVVSNGKMSMEQLADILADIHPFVTAIHLREKQKSARELYQAIQLLSKRNIPLSKIIINDRVDVALVTGVAGVQLAYHSLETTTVKKCFPQLTVGYSIHSLEEGQQSEQDRAEYVIYGHIFPSKSKPGLTPRGLDELKRITSLLDIPVIAIGGITPKNTFQTMQAGASGIAVMSGILEALDPLSAVKAYKQALENGDE
ncbi:thiazole tautomerase TenI [Bacillus sp. EB600]|uniref:thiazole tautomerase TenI n=1 Tax=Bacillus sp. EB600 TaxID=2806345 RepID=UPI00210DC5F7|nr:thiazole tautomerase TenI [Bacillus sp. EB600]